MTFFVVSFKAFFAHKKKTKCVFFLHLSLTKNADKDAGACVGIGSGTGTFTFLKKGVEFFAGEAPT